MRTQRLPRFDRKFDFDGDVGGWDELLERLRRAPRLLERLMRGVPRSALMRRDGEAWSIQEHAGHLWDLEDLHRRRLLDYAARAAEMRPADLSCRRTQEAHHNDDDPDSILADFRFERELLAGRLSAMTAEERGRVAAHPRLDRPLRVVDLMRFIAEHDDHHLERIRKLVERFAA